MKIYNVEDGDINEEVEDEGDFGAYFEDMDVNSGEEVDFCVELLAGYKINVDLNAGDCKENLIFTIPRTDLKNETEWMESFQEIETQIGKKLNNNEWEKEFSLLNKKNNRAVNKKLEDFINVFRNNKNRDIVQFYLRV